jgi:twitching motility protein PilT
MAIFNRKSKNLMQRAMDSDWAGADDKSELIEELRTSGIRSSEALQLVWHRDSGIRSVGADLFLDKVDKKAAMVLADQMVSEASHKRSFAMRIFARFSDELLDSCFEELRRDGNPQKQRLGWDIVLNLQGQVGEKYLEKAVTQAPAAMRVTALQRLIKQSKLEQIMGILVACAKGTEERLASTALEALVSLETDNVIDLMIDRVAHGDATSRQMAAEYLRKAARRDPQRMRQSMLELMSEGEDATRRLSVEILLATGDPAEVILAVLMFSKDLVGWLRTRILETLQTFGDEVLKPAAALLQHKDDKVRTAALVLAEKFEDPRLVGPVCKMLNDEDWWLRISACDTLGRLKDERAVPHLVKALSHEEVRWAAIDALAQIGSSKALKPLAQLLRDKRKEVRAEVVRAFGRFTDKRLLPLLKQVMDTDPTSEVRTLAAEVLREMSTRLEVDSDISGSTMAVSSESMELPIDKLLAWVREQGGSDLHITCGEPPFWRQSGSLVRIEGQDVITADQCREMVLSTLKPYQRKIFDEAGEVDFCYSIPEVGRYRANAFEQRLGTCATFRVIPNLPPTFADLRIPGRLTELLDFHQGLIVVSGPAASGKSTTLAAIINLINESKPTHVITMEEPIEFVHPIKTALVNQREIGSHTENYARALRGALRQDPDVIMVGELRDPEVIAMALEAAETGHLVIATLHTTSALATVDRIIKSFPPEEQGQVRMGLSEALKYVVCQSLLPKKDGSGRVAVFEILKTTFSLSSVIREDKLQLIPSMMQIGRNVGMQTVDMALEDLVESGLISPESAWARAEKQELFEPLCDPSFLAEHKAVS